MTGPSLLLRSVVQGPPKGQPRRKALAALDLNSFIQRQRVLSLWRDFLRVISKMEEPSARKDMKSWVRREFERNKTVEDPIQMKYLISTGKTELKQLERYAGR